MELSEVLKTRKRICDYMTKHCLSCDECPVGVFDDDLCLFDLDPSLAEKYENILAQWNREHPVKTLKDILLERFPNAQLGEHGVPGFCVRDLGLVTMDICKKMNDCTECWNREWKEDE